MTLGWGKELKVEIELMSIDENAKFEREDLIGNIDLRSVKFEFIPHLQILNSDIAQDLLTFVAKLELMPVGCDNFWGDG